MSHLTHLRTFLEAYRLRSFSKAAERIAITQPAASQHIQALESLTGKPLFVRSARGVTPTAAADELARAVAPFLDGLEQKLATFRTSSESAAGTVHIAGPGDFIHSELGWRLAPMMQRGFSFRLHTGNRSQIYELLGDHSVDLAVTSSAPNEKEYDYAHLLTERMYIVFSPLLLGKLSLQPTAAELEAVPLLAFDEDLALVRPLWTKLFQNAPYFQAALTIPDLRTIKDLVVAGHGWTVLPDYQCEGLIQSGMLVPGSHKADSPTNTLFLTWHKGIQLKSHVVSTRDFILSAFSTRNSETSDCCPPDDTTP
jgi:DNA-binding transcriptional LysR family regulator